MVEDHEWILKENLSRPRIDFKTNFLQPTRYEQPIPDDHSLSCETLLEVKIVNL